MITTSRDPSAKARRFGRLLAAFLSIPYVTRGKLRLDERETWLVVFEDHGNPTGLAKRLGDTTEKMAFNLISEGAVGSRRFRGSKPQVMGEKDDALPVSRFFELDWLEEPLSGAAVGRYMVVASGQIDFVDEGETIFRLKI